MLSIQTTNSDLSDLPVAELEEKIAALSAQLSAGTCRLLELLAEIDRRSPWLVHSTTDWLAWRCALSPRTAREYVRVARSLEELPQIHAAFARGELSYAKVRALTRVAEPETEEALLPIAFALTAAQLERALGAYRRVSTAEARKMQEHAYLSWSWDEHGTLVISGRLTPEEGATFLRALQASKDDLRSQGGEGQCGSAEPRIKNADALVAMAEHQLAGTRTPRLSGERYQVVVHVDADALAAEESAGCQLEDGPALCAEAVRRIACDSSLVTILERDGEPLNVGRKRRTVPTALHRALARRDRRCRFPGCENRLGLDAHHVQHWAHGGETRLANLLLLCRRHHRLLHEGGFRAEVLADSSVRFLNPWGEPIPDVPRPPPASLDELLEANEHLEIDGYTNPTGENEQTDLHSVIEALCDVTGRL